MKRVILIVATALAVLVGVPPVIAAEKVSSFSTENGDLIVLIDAPCTATLGVLANVPEDIRAKLKAAVVRFNGQALEACWGLTEDNKHFIIDQTGDVGVIEGSAFQPQGDPL